VAPSLQDSETPAVSAANNQIFWTVRVNGAAFDVYYEHLLLLSFWSDVKNELCSGIPCSAAESLGFFARRAQSKI
jgi:hypothetical protein